jgi:hypothetical protein
MINNIGLSRDEICEVTGKIKPYAQARELDHMRIPYVKRHNGTLFVARAAANEVMGLSSRVAKSDRTQEISYTELEIFQNGKTKKNRQAFA